MKTNNKVRKIILTVILLIILVSNTSCSYFYPVDKYVFVPELVDKSELKHNYITVTLGDIVNGATIGINGVGSCVFTNDPMKTTIANAGLGFQYADELYVAEGQYVNEGDKLIRYTYEIDTDMEFDLSIAARRAELKYEDALQKYSRGEISSSALNSYKVVYANAKDKLDALYAIEDTYTLYAPCSGVIARIEGYSVDPAETFDVSFYICNIEDGILLISAPVSNENAEDIIFSLKEGRNLEMSNADDTITYDMYVEMANVNIKKIYTDYISELGGASNIYMILEFKNGYIPEEITFNQNFSTVLIESASYQVVVIPISVMEFDSDYNPYVYVLGDQNTTEIRYITLGIGDGMYFEVTSGLSVDDKVLSK
ncbi:MAG: hypothetical protein WCY62_01900 [Clostridia bacterium]|jgi:hypothetical protein